MNHEQAKPSHSGLATASLTLGILAIALAAVGIGGILGILAIVFGAVSIKYNRGKSLAGIITGITGIVLSVLILVFVFAITPQTTENIQQSQRDTQRKNDISVLVSDVLYRASEDQGKIPEWTYVNDMTYKLAVVKSAASGESGAEPTTSQAVYAKGIDCDGNTGVRKYSLTILLESGSKYCQDS